MYSSYRHLFHNKKSTTIFIKEGRWAGKRGAHPGMSSHITAQNWRHADTPPRRRSPPAPRTSLLSTSTLGIRNSREPVRLSRVGSCSIKRRRGLLAIAAHFGGREDGIAGLWGTPGKASHSCPQIASSCVNHCFLT